MSWSTEAEVEEAAKEDARWHCFFDSCYVVPVKSHSDPKQRLCPQCGVWAKRIQEPEPAPPSTPRVWPPLGIWR